MCPAYSYDPVNVFGTPDYWQQDLFDVNLSYPLTFLTCGIAKVWYACSCCLVKFSSLNQGTCCNKTFNLSSNWELFYCPLSCKLSLRTMAKVPWLAVLWSGKLRLRTYLQLSPTVSARMRAIQKNCKPYSLQFACLACTSLTLITLHVQPSTPWHPLPELKKKALALHADLQG